MLKLRTFAATTTVVLVILAGTLMPGSVKAAIEHELWQVVPWSALAHFVLFTTLAWVMTRDDLRRMVAPALGLALVLAAGTEWMQQFVPGRHTRLIDVGIDMTGAALGCALALWINRRRPQSGQTI
jgi:VanZ family protein